MTEEGAPSYNFPTTILTEKPPAQAAAILPLALESQQKLNAQVGQWFEQYISVINNHTKQLKQTVEAGQKIFGGAQGGIDDDEFGNFPQYWNCLLTLLKLEAQLNELMVKNLKMDVLGPLRQEQSDVRVLELLVNSTELAEISQDIGNHKLNAEVQWNYKAPQIFQNFEDYKAQQFGLLFTTVLTFFQIDNAKLTKGLGNNENLTNYLVSNYKLESQMRQYLEVITQKTYKPPIAPPGHVGAAHYGQAGAGQLNERKQNRRLLSFNSLGSSLKHDDGLGLPKKSLKLKVGSIFGRKKDKKKNRGTSGFGDIPEDGLIVTTSTEATLTRAGLVRRTNSTALPRQPTSSLAVDRTNLQRSTDRFDRNPTSNQPQPPQQQKQEFSQQQQQQPGIAQQQSGFAQQQQGSFPQQGQQGQQGSFQQGQGQFPQSPDRLPRSPLSPVLPGLNTNYATPLVPLQAHPPHQSSQTQQLLSFSSPMVAQHPAQPLDNLPSLLDPRSAPVNSFSASNTDTSGTLGWSHSTTGGALGAGAVGAAAGAAIGGVSAATVSGLPQRDLTTPVTSPFETNIAANPPFTPQQRDANNNADFGSLPNFVQYQELELELDTEHEGQLPMLQRHDVALPAKNQNQTSRARQLSYERGDETHHLPEPTVGAGDDTSGVQRRLLLGRSAPPPPPLRKVVHHDTLREEPLFGTPDSPEGFANLPAARNSVVPPISALSGAGNSGVLMAQETGALMMRLEFKHFEHGYNASGLNALVAEVINATFTDGQLVKSQVVGEVAFHQQGESAVGAVDVAILPLHRLDRVILNEDVLKPLASKDHYQLAPAQIASKTLGAFKYLIKQPLVPLTISQIWKYESHQALLIILVKPDPLVTTPLKIDNLVITVALDTSVEVSLAKLSPHGSFNKDKNRLTWRYPRTLILGGAGGKTEEKLMARFTTHGVGREHELGVQVKFSMAQPPVANVRVVADGDDVPVTRSLILGNYLGHTV